MKDAYKTNGIEIVHRSDSSLRKLELISHFLIYYVPMVPMAFISSYLKSNVNYKNYGARHNEINFEIEYKSRVGFQGFCYFCFKT